MKNSKKQSRPNDPMAERAPTLAPGCHPFPKKKRWPIKYHGSKQQMNMELWYEWEENNEEHLSFDDSDRFEEDSLCSWVSEPESICGNWRGWKRNSQSGVQVDSDLGEGKVELLLEICARTVAKYLPFETVERIYPQIPEQLQLRIAFWSFPPFEEDIRLYSCLANGSPDKFTEGEQLLKVQAVKDALQIGKSKIYIVCSH